MIRPPVPAAEGLTDDGLMLELIANIAISRISRFRPLTSFWVHSVLLRRLNKIWDRRFEGVVGSQNVNVDDRFESIRRELVDRG